MEGDSAGFGESGNHAGFSMPDQAITQQAGDVSTLDISGSAGQFLQASSLP